MEFHEKLQQLRKQKDLTQEQLAQQLFVSRTAISKWESGRGYPNLESLKGISKLFSVSIDELLSNDELIELAQTEKRDTISKVSVLVFGAMDLITLAFLFLPLSGQQDGPYIRAVALLWNPEFSALLRFLYFIPLAIISLFGLFELVTASGEHEKWLPLCVPCSMMLYAVAILVFALSRQPYITALLFLLFVVKLVLTIPEKRIR